MIFQPRLPPGPQGRLHLHDRRRPQGPAQEAALHHPRAGGGVPVQELGRHPLHGKKGRHLDIRGQVTRTDPIER